MPVGGVETCGRLLLTNVTSDLYLYRLRPASTKTSQAQSTPVEIPAEGNRKPIHGGLLSAITQAVEIRSAVTEKVIWVAGEREGSANFLVEPDIVYSITTAMTSSELGAVLKHSKVKRLGMIWWYVVPLLKMPAGTGQSALSRGATHELFSLGEQERRVQEGPIATAVSSCSRSYFSASNFDEF